MRGTVQQENPGAGLGELARLIGHKWIASTAEEKEVRRYPAVCLCVFGCCELADVAISQGIHTGREAGKGGV